MVEQLLKHDETEGVAYNGVKYRQGYQMVVQASREIDLLPVSDDIKEAMKAIAEKAVKGALQASEAVHITPQNYQDRKTLIITGRAGGDRDYPTDKKGLDDLPKFFTR